MLWKDFKKAVYTKRAELNRSVKKAPKFVLIFVQVHLKHLVEVIVAKGGSTSYYRVYTETFQHYVKLIIIFLNISGGDTVV